MPCKAGWWAAAVGAVAVAVLGSGLAWAADDSKGKDKPRPPKIKWEKRQLKDDLNEGIAVGDINQDGKLDITSGTSWYEGPDFKAHPLRELVVDNEEFMTNNGEHLFDLNGDGFLDVIAGSWFSDKLSWYENPGRTGLAAGDKWAEHPIVDGQNACEGTLLLDLDGDKIPEITVNSWDENKPMTVVRITPGKSGQAPQFERVDVGDKGYGHGIAVGDVNGDKRPDIVVPRGWFEQPAKDPWTRKWKFHPGPELVHSSLPGLIVDINGDGRNDIIIGHAHDYGLFWLEQGPAKEGEITWTRHDIDKSISQYHCLIWTDLDGDGSNEVVTGKRWRGHKGADPGSADPICIARYLWDPIRGTFERDFITYNDKVGTGMQIRAVDLNGDRKLDIAVAGKTGTYVLFNRGPAEK